MRRDQLFSGAPELTPSAGEVRLDGEALHSPIEGYVLGDMPAALRGIVTAERLEYGQLAERQADVLTEALPAIEANEDPEVAKLTQLDLLFMLGGYVPAV